MRESVIEYAHRDNYYIFALIVGGKCRVCIDFAEHALSEGEVVITQPGQVHHLADTGDAKAFLLFIDSVYISPSDKQIIEEYALSTKPFKIKMEQAAELKTIFPMIQKRISEGRENSHSIKISEHLVRAVIGIIIEQMQGFLHQTSKNKRRTEIVLAFKELLLKEEHIERKPSSYAKKLHLSPVYLNEVVKEITGISVSRYLQNEIVLRAKRMLVHTSMNIMEIAFYLGFDDYAYFTRFFKKNTGINPSEYRKKNLE